MTFVYTRSYKKYSIYTTAYKNDSIHDCTNTFILIYLRSILFLSFQSHGAIRKRCFIKFYPYNDTDKEYWSIRIIQSKDWIKYGIVKFIMSLATNARIWDRCQVPCAILNKFLGIF
jgi:hypothetical protein